MSSLNNDRPRKIVVIHYYSKFYYDARGIRKRVEADWKAVEMIHPSTDRLKIQNRSILDCWNEETVGFQEEVKAAAAAQDATDMETYERGLYVKPDTINDYV
jgi:hypothetical protein